MTIEPEMLMAYADGELDPLNAKRVERAIAGDPALVQEVERHRALRKRIADNFAPVADEQVPDRLAALLKSSVVDLPLPRTRPIVTRWREATALAACLVLGLVIGIGLPHGPVSGGAGGLYASGSLARALDDQVGGADGTVKVAVSFRDKQGSYCRVFSARVTDGIACRDASGWVLRRTQQGSSTQHGDYAQAGSPDPDLMAAAQDMMAGEPLDAKAEEAARGAGWR
ncbi:anti-sigma factor family protein [Sphingomonas pruni]|uniref:anti-sigma factor family protein n=1 Tax=Sphingomonas pruni TaxID=40683 RepID=UPI000A94EA26|nr:anti-sigma factor [Sphingomonas pruni]